MADAIVSAFARDLSFKKSAFGRPPTELSTSPAEAPVFMGFPGAGKTRMARPVAGVAFGAAGCALFYFVATLLLSDGSTYFTTWALFVHALIFAGVGLRAFDNLLYPSTAICPEVDAYLSLVVDFGATLALAVAVTIVVVLEENHDHIFKDETSCARLFSGHFAGHFVPFFLYALLYADKTRATEKLRPVEPVRATILVSSAVNLLFFYTLCYDVEEVYGLDRTEAFWAATGFALAGALIATLLA